MHHGGKFLCPTLVISLLGRVLCNSGRHPANRRNVRAEATLGISKWTGLFRNIPRSIGICAKGAKSALPAGSRFGCGCRYLGGVGAFEGESARRHSATNPVVFALVGRPGRRGWISACVASPRLNDEGMRPQLIKLLVRWNALPMSSGVFAQPFAKRQAWLLLQQGALRALPEMKEITFHSTGQAPIARIAALRVIWRVVALIEGGASAEALSAASMLGSSRWTRLEIADIVFWSWASADAKKATSENWNTATWRWKLDDDRIQRLR